MPPLAEMEVMELSSGTDQTICIQVLFVKLTAGPLIQAVSVRGPLGEVIDFEGRAAGGRNHLAGQSGREAYYGRETHIK